MKIQEAAHALLTECGQPMSSRDIAELALERQMVSSNARGPVLSLAQTLEKNVRGGVYNRPSLKFIHTPRGRLLGLPEWDDGPSLAPQRSAQRKVLYWIQVEKDMKEDRFFARIFQRENRVLEGGMPESFFRHLWSTYPESESEERAFEIARRELAHYLGEREMKEGEEYEVSRKPVVGLFRPLGQ